jgi:hypothetical protein
MMALSIAHGGAARQGGKDLSDREPSGTLMGIINTPSFDALKLILKNAKAIPLC